MVEEMITFTNAGQRLYGMLHRPDGVGPFPAVAMLHGFTGDRFEPHRLFVKTARDLAAHGIAALRFDFRGSGESEGDFEDVTVSGEVSDARAALDFLAAHPAVDADRLGLLGISLGGCVAALVAGDDDRVKALVLWSAVGHLLEVLTALAPPGAAEQMQRQGWVDLGGWKLGMGFIRELPDLDPLGAAARYSGPALILHGDADESVPVSEAHAYARRMGQRAQVRIIPGADHTYNRLDWEAEVIRRSREWLVEHLVSLVTPHG